MLKQSGVAAALLRTGSRARVPNSLRSTQHSVLSTMKKARAIAQALVRTEWMRKRLSASQPLCGGLTLRELEAAAGTGLAVLLTLDLTRVAGHHAGLAEDFIKVGIHI